VFEILRVKVTEISGILKQSLLTESIDLRHNYEIYDFRILDRIFRRIQSHETGFDRVLLKAWLIG